MRIENDSKLTTQMQADFSRKLFMRSFIKNISIIEAISAFAVAYVLIWALDNYGWAIGIGVFMVVYPIITIVLFNSGLRKMQNGKNGDDNFDEVHTHFTIEETIITADITFNGGANQVVQALNTFTQIWETKDLFVLILENQQAFFIEKSGFLTITDCNKVGDILKLLPKYKYMK